VKVPQAIHAWSVTPKRAVAIQRELAGLVRRRGRPRQVRLVAGADLAFSHDKTACVAGVVVWDVSRQTVVEQHTAWRPVVFPYVPGLLSFREAPAILKVLRKLSCDPDVFLFDGQGFAHPRRFGLASHLGVLLDRPSIGCAKTLLVGSCDMPETPRGSTSPLLDKGERIGMALRTRDGVKPVYVSVGHRLSLEAAVDITLKCAIRYRLPEPTRLADQLVADERTSPRR
jgi:deoxyribonuclease V